MSQPDLPIHSDPDIMGGTPVFVGTRVPFQTLLDYLEAGDPLDEFLEDFPTVSREQAIAAPEAAKDRLLESVRAACWQLDGCCSMCTSFPAPNHEQPRH